VWLTFRPRPRRRIYDALGKNLTKRQAQVLQKLASGHTNKAIAEHLGLSIYTVRCHDSAVFRALDVSNRTQAALIARDLLQ